MSSLCHVLAKINYLNAISNMQMGKPTRNSQSMPEYASVCQSMQEYAKVCQSMPEYARVCQSIHVGFSLLKADLVHFILFSLLSELGF